MPQTKRKNHNLESDSQMSVYQIEALATSFDVLESLLSFDGGSARQTDICRQLGLNKSRVFRILTNLEQRGYVEQDPHTQEYRLGLRLLVLGDNVRQRLSLWDTANPLLSDLAEESGDGVHLIILLGTRAFCIASHYGHNMLQARTPHGVPMQLHVGASPKLLLAYLPQDERDRIIEEMELRFYTPNTITSREGLRARLEQIRQDGFSADEEDFELGVYAVAAPVRDDTGRVVAGITITTPKQRHNPDRQKELTQMAVNVAARLSTLLGFMGGVPR